MIRPSGSQICGNHVAGRKYSYLNQHYLFHTFTPPNGTEYLENYSNYTDYVADIFRYER